MNIIAVDDERRALDELLNTINEVTPDSVVSGFRNAEKALEYAKENLVDVAFLDIHMRGIDGLGLAEKLKGFNENINIIFVTGYSQHMGDAFDMHASGYVMKPIESEEVAKQLDNLRRPVNHNEKRVYIQCFGNFEIFVDGKPVEFKRSKSKELLAFLVDRKGATVTNKECSAILWEDVLYTRSIQSYLQTIIVELIRALKAVDALNILIRKRGRLAINVAEVDCDAYEFEKNRERNFDGTVNNFTGEYMTNYSWGELRIGQYNSQ